jgi:hypothetical protein
MAFRTTSWGRCLAAFALALPVWAASGCAVSSDAPKEVGGDPLGASDDGLTARKLSWEEKAAEVGRKLAQVRPGMTRKQVEAILGPPDWKESRRITGRWAADPDGQYKYVEYPYALYYASPPNLPPGVHLMTVVYRGDPLAPIPPDAVVVEVTGPHTPDAARPPDDPKARD